MIDPEQVNVWLGMDVGKSEHFHTTIDDQGEELAAGPVINDEAAIRSVIRATKEFGRPGVVIDQPGSIAAMVLAVARQEGVPVAYIPGLVMRRAAQLYPGAAKTDPRDSRVLADTARTHRKRIHWLAPNDELLEQLRVLVGFDNDLTVDVNRTTNRLPAMRWSASLPPSSGPWATVSTTPPPERSWLAGRRRALCGRRGRRCADGAASTLPEPVTASPMTSPPPSPPRPSPCPPKPRSGG